MAARSKNMPSPVSAMMIALVRNLTLAVDDEEDDTASLQS